MDSSGSGVIKCQKHMLKDYWKHSSRISHIEIGSRLLCIGPLIANIERQKEWIDF